MTSAGVRQLIDDLRDRRAPFVFHTPNQGALADRAADSLEELLRAGVRGFVEPDDHRLRLGARR